MKWKKFSKQQLHEFVKQSKSYRSLSIKIGYSQNSGSANICIKQMIDAYKFDTSHFTGELWNKGLTDYSTFINGKKKNTSSLIRGLTKIRQHKCEKCLRVEWDNQLITLEVHHLDGNNINNEIANLVLLCPNCHSQTSNWRKSNKNNNKISDKIFLLSLKKSKNIRQALLKIGLSAKGDNYARARHLISKHNLKKFIS